MRFALTVLPVVIGGSMLACTPQLMASDCATGYIHHSSDAPKDFGQGHVLVESGYEGYISDADAWGANELTLWDCNSGQWVEARVAEQNEYSEYVYNHIDASNAALDSVKADAPETWIDGFETRMRKLGARIRYKETADSETCGCRVFYPDLRGDKKPYEA